MKKKIVLFRGRPNKQKSPTLLPLGLLAIAAPLEKEYDITVLDANVDEDYLDRAVSEAKDAVCVGISTMTGVQIKEGLEVAKDVKERYPDVPVVWGGFHPSILPEQTIENPLVDIVVVGQGERTFQELVRALSRHKSPKGVKGILYKENGRVIQTEPRPFESLDSFPSYAFHLVDVKRYLFKSEFGERTATYVSSYGCAHACRFCAEQKMFKRRWLARSPKRVVEDFKRLKELGADGVWFGDNNFFQNTERVTEICKSMIAENLRISWFNANGRIEALSKLDDGYWETMRQSGCRSILVGLESGSQKVLEFIDKDNEVGNALVVAEKAEKMGIKVIWSTMLGFPHADGFDEPIEQEFDATMDLLIKINRISDNHKMQWFPFAPYPETPIYGACLKAGFVGPDSLEGWAEYDFENAGTPWVPEKYARLLRQLDEYVFPYASRSYLFRTMRKLRGHGLGFLEPVITVPAMLLHWTATFRMEHKFFSLPIEHMVIRRMMGAVD